ncbi:MULTISPECIES: glycerophosphodiester phosphodiesterase family protein [unclassified Brevundimonas]|uniref:glycerophosphodiester phosphodiesterase family protein n=1 Tax=unclassified Brevundimonas TaxID=2622653 RepID=UPI0025B91CEB|nr:MULTISPECIES: glycerophosphodiester phosphodiesterase family protein [unclassified Brevundimonas]
MTQPAVIAHRGCSGERPEHTRSAYERAIDQGADYIEPDLVMSRDGHLVVRHENEIGETTDVANHPHFTDRRRKQVIDGRTVQGWFTEDFTLEELKSLRARERLPELRPQSAGFDGQDTILTFAEVVEIARAGAARTGRSIGVAPELKHPSHLAAAGLDIEAAFLREIHRLELAQAGRELIVQCFEVGPLQRLAGRTNALLLQLMDTAGGPIDRPDITYADMATPQGLADIARYAGMIGVNTRMVVPWDNAGHSMAPTSLVTDAHAAGLEVVLWTLRAENHFLPAERRRGDTAAAHGDLDGYIRALYALGVDAVFSDFPAIAVQARASQSAWN